MNATEFRYQIHSFTETQDGMGSVVRTPVHLLWEETPGDELIVGNRFRVVRALREHQALADEFGIRTALARKSLVSGAIEWDTFTSPSRKAVAS